MRADEILRESLTAMNARARERDHREGERSMRRIVAAFNALYAEKVASQGGMLTEVDGWRFMEVLKLGRGQGPDEFIDGAAYAGLAGEAAAKERGDV